MCLLRKAIYLTVFGLLCVLNESSATLSNVRQFRNSKLTIQNPYQVKMDLTDDNNVNFMVIGDWGGIPVFPFRTLIESTVSKLMTTLATKYNTQFQLALGDNFYFHGVKDVNDSRFRDTYEKVFDSKPLVETPWLAIMGNHDHYGNASAQVAYTDVYKRWIMPSYNYSVDIKPAGTQQPLIRFIMLDTVSMCGNTGYDWNTDDVEPKFASRQDKINSRQYFVSLERELAKLKDEYIPYVIVSGHFPVWSIAEHGPTKCLLNQLRPLLHKYNVSAYFCGHDHSLQHLTDTYLDQTVEYMVIGASNFVQNSTEHAGVVPPNSLKYYWAYGDGIINGGMSLVRANNQNLTFTFIETNGKELYEKVLYPRWRPN